MDEAGKRRKRRKKKEEEERQGRRKGNEAFARASHANQADEKAVWLAGWSRRHEAPTALCHTVSPVRHSMAAMSSQTFNGGGHAMGMDIPLPCLNRQ
jgi:hypothetical protein